MSAARRPAAPGAASRWRLPLGVFVLLTSCTLLAWREQSQAQSEAQAAATLRDSAAHSAELRDRLRLHAQFLKSLSAFATANLTQELDAWQRYAREIAAGHKLNGLFGFAYAPAVAPAEQAAFSARLGRQLQRPDFTIHPAPGNQTATPVVFRAPGLPGAQAPLGFNLLSDHARREAIETAIASRDIALSGRVTLLGDQQARHPGFILAQALYRTGMPIDDVQARRRAFAGVVVTAYRIDEFLAALNFGSSSQFALQIFDEGSNSRQAVALPPSLIYDSAPDFKPTADTPVFHHEIDFGGRNWVLHYRQREHYGARGLDAASVVLLGGLLGSLLLTLLVAHLGSHRRRAEAYTRQVTAELHRSEERMRLATSASNDGLWDQDLLTGEDYASGRMAEIFGFPVAAPPQRMDRYIDCIHPEDLERRNAELRRQMRANKSFDLELRIDKADGSGLAWVRIRGEAVRNAAGRAVRVAGSVSDITERKMAEARLDRLRRLLTTTITAMPLPVFIHDARRKLQMVNAAFCELMGAAEGPLLNGFWPDFAGIGDDDRRRLIGAGERALGSGHCDALEFELQPPGRPARRLIARTAQAQNPEGEPFLITTLTDVTELRAAAAAIKAADRMKQAVLDAATEVAIIATDPSGLITVFNRGAERMLGYPASELVGRETPLLLHQASEVAARGSELSRPGGRPVEGFEVFSRVPQSGLSEQRDWTYIRKDGERLTVNLATTAQRDPEGRITGYLGIAIDVSQRKRAERELEQHREHLRELVAERTRRLDAALQQAQAASLAKSEFLANMSHELRTPMHAILSFAELGENRAELAGEAKLSQYFSRVGQSARRLLGLINDLLDLAKLEAGRVELRPAPIDVAELLHQAGSHLESLLQARHLTLAIDNDGAVGDIVGDPVRITQVIHNLLSNAIKFSPSGGQIRVQLSPAGLPFGGEVRPALAISFCDSGIGIPAGELESIFDKFVQSSATKTGAGGTGLGLAISREIVVQHRGTIAAKNLAVGGACFTVTLPLNLWMERLGPHD